MTFKVRKTAYRAWPVTVLLQEGDAAGNVIEVAQRFVVHFRPFTEAEHQDIVDALEKAFPLPEGKERHGIDIALQRNAEYFFRLLAGWGAEVTDESGQPIPYSAEALADLVTGPDGLAVSAGLVRAVNELRFGVAPEKNSSPSVAPGDSSAATGGATSSPTT